MRGAETKVGLEILYADTHPVALIADTDTKRVECLLVYTDSYDFGMLSFFLGFKCDVPYFPAPQF